MVWEEFTRMNPDLRNDAEPVVIACVHEEVLKITRVCERCKPARIHLISYKYYESSKNDESKMTKRGFHKQFLDAICKIISGRDNFDTDKLDENGSRCGESIVHVYRSWRDYEFSHMSAALNMILEREKSSKVYLSISGTEEFTVAATLAYMTHDNVELVSTICSDRRDFEQATEGYRNPNGGLTGTVTTANMCHVTAPHEIPDMRLLKAFKVYVSMSDRARKSHNVMRSLAVNGLWREGCDSFEEQIRGTSVELEDTDDMDSWRDNPKLREGADETEYNLRMKREGMEFTRKFLNKWIELMWLEADTGRIRTRGAASLEGWVPDELFAVTRDMIVPKNNHMNYTENDQYDWHVDCEW